jgi:5-methyltetrahydropteroyltriglutamate--homocysteine methyltransferase
MAKGPFRADHVGSLLRPAELKEARAKAASSQITPEELRAVEDRCIRDVVKLQEEVGLQSVTDGEFRRAMWHTDFLTGFQGIVPTHSQYAVKFHGKGGETAETRSMLVVNDKVRRTKPVMVDHVAFLKSVTTRTAKFCMPAATYLHVRGGRKLVDPKIYPDIQEFWDDIATAYQQEIDDIAKTGCDYIQIDDVSFAYLCDESICAQIAADGEDPKRLPALYTKIINTLISKRPANMTVTVHTCRGNHDSMWMASGGYEAVAEAFFTTTNVDGFFLEFDTERAGGFEPLRFVPKGKKVVLGLVSSKEATVESKDSLKRRIEEASKFIPLEQLCLSPQCGFASTAPGNRITEDIERKKLALIVEVATEVWGTAGA